MLSSARISRINWCGTCEIGAARGVVSSGCRLAGHTCAAGPDARPQRRQRANPVIAVGEANLFHRDEVPALLLAGQKHHPAADAGAGDGQQPHSAGRTGPGPHP